MSHFALMVRVPASTRVEDFEKVLEPMMIPYKEYGCGDDDGPELEKYLEFEDKEDEYRKEYETGTSSMLRLADGEEVSAYDERFRNSTRTIFSDEPQWLYPADAVKFEKPHKECWPTFEEFMADWHGSERDKKKGRYGHWHNPNDKWDWWTIGGRWTGHFLVGYEPSADRDNYKKCWLCNGSGTRPDGNYEGQEWAREPSLAGHPVIGKGCNGCHGTGWELKWNSEYKPVGNFSRIRNIYWTEVDKAAKGALDEFWQAWLELCDGKEFEAFDGPRHKALSLGLLDCKAENELTGTEWKVVPWDKPGTPEDKKRHRYDVLKQTTKEWLEANCLESFSPIGTWARLDAKHGWQEKGKMGWFGVGRDTPESNRKHASTLRDWLAEGDQDDWVIVVDCHI